MICIFQGWVTKETKNEQKTQKELTNTKQQTQAQQNKADIKHQPQNKQTKKETMKASSLQSSL